MLIDIALDAVGTDKAPEAEIRGAILACKALPVRVHLVGPEAELRDLLDEALGNDDLPIVIHNATERIGMEEKAAHAYRTKKDSSIRVGLKLVRDGTGGGLCNRRQHRRGHGHGQDAYWARCRGWTVPLWRRRCPVRRATPACCWTWAPMSIARPTIWRSLP